MTHAILESENTSVPDVSVNSSNVKALKLHLVLEDTEDGHLVLLTPNQQNQLLQLLAEKLGYTVTKDHAK